MSKLNNILFEKQVKSTTENLSLIRDFIRNCASAKKVRKAIIDKIILAVDEACTNIIKHAYHSNPNGEIRVVLEFTTDKCRIILIDFGDSFNPDLIPEPDMPTYLKERKVGGLGLYLIRSLMDEVEYHSGKDGYNQLTITKYINGEESE